MDSRHLAYFRQIVDSGSLAAAARDLGIAQPSLSQHVKNLEQHLGTELLLRTTRGVTPTEAGLLLYEHAVQVVELLRSAEEQVRAACQEPAGRVVLGLPASVSMALSVPLAETVRVELPRVSLCAAETMSGYIKQWLRDGVIDIALLYDLDGLTDCVSRLLVTEDLYFVAAADSWPFPSAPGSPVLLRDLEGLELVLPSACHGLRLLIDRTCRQTHVPLEVVLEMDSLQQIKALVERGSAFTVLSPAAIHDLVSGGTLVQGRIVDPVIRRPVHLVRSARKAVTLASRAVEQVCEEVIRDLVARGIWQADVVPHQPPEPKKLGTGGRSAALSTALTE